MPRINFSILTNEEENNSQQKEEQQTKKQKKKRKHESKVKYYTHDGHPLTPQEALFIDKYLELGNQRQAVIEAGYKTKNPGGYAYNIMKKEYIGLEIAYRLKKLEEESIASAVEIMQYFTKVMRGEEKDQFGLEVPVSERTRAAQELAKRKIDIPNRVAGKEVAEVKISLDWTGMEGEDETDAGQETE